MKAQTYQKRFYREWTRPPLRRARINIGETDLEILTDLRLDRRRCAERVREYRRAIESYIERDPRFLTALKPVAVDPRAQKLVKEMAAAARAAGVGPMAAVAGAIAQTLGRALLEDGFRDVVIENGGDIFLKVRQPVTVGIYAGASRASRRLGIRIRPGQTPCGVCTSSGTVGHSLSFGSCDSATVIARDAGLADACATGLGNRVRSRQDLAPAIRYARSVPGVTAACVVIGEDIAAWGKLELVSS